jgi:hypothetical protein
VFVLIGISSLAFSQSASKASIPPDVPNAKRILAYVDAFNSDEKKMAEFLKENVSEAALQQRSLDDRLAIYRQMHERMTSIEIIDVPDVQVGAKGQAITTLVRTGKGEMVNIIFILNRNPQISWWHCAWRTPKVSQAQVRPPRMRKSP